MSTYAPLSYTATEGQTDFTISFSYLAQAHIQVYVNEVLKELTTDYTIVSGTTLRFNSGLTSGDRVYIRRSTNLGTDALEITLGVGARLNASDLNDSFKQIAYPAQEFMAEAISEVVRTENNLSDIANASLARTNLGLETKSATDSRLDALISESSNLGDLTDYAAARTNLDVYSTSEVRTAIDTAKANAYAPEEGAVFCTSLEYSPIVMNCRLLIDSVNNKKIVLTSFNGNYLWCNGAIRLFYVTSLTTSGLSNSTLYYVYLRCDEDGGFYLYTSTDVPTTYRSTYVNIVSGEYRPLVGYIYTSSNYSTNGIVDVASVYNRYTRTKKITFNPPPITVGADTLQDIYTPVSDDYIIAQPGNTVKASLLFSHQVEYWTVGSEYAVPVSWTNYFLLISKDQLQGSLLTSTMHSAYSVFLGSGQHQLTTTTKATALGCFSGRWYLKTPAQTSVHGPPDGAGPWDISTYYLPGAKVYIGYKSYVAVNFNAGDKPPSKNWSEISSLKEHRTPDLYLRGHGGPNAYILISVQ